MDDRGKIVSTYEVDENIALQIWTKGLSPRLVVFNKNQNTRKLIHLSWLENTDRRFSVRGEKRGSSAEYRIADLLPVLQRILSEYAVYAPFKPRLWKFATALERILHMPTIIFERSELSLLSEEKRSSLWLADVSAERRGEGVFRPFFPLSPAEKVVLPEEGLPISENRRGVEDLFKTGAIRRLSEVRPERWLRPMRFMAAAMLLGFSFCGEDGSELSDALWDREGTGKLPAFKITDPCMMGLGRKFVGFVRHFDAVGKITVRISHDNNKDLQKEEYLRKRRIELPAGIIGDVQYSVTFFEREDGMMALGCKPQAATLKHRGELIYSFPASIYGQALANDAFDGTPDEYYTIMQLVSAKEFAEWLEKLAPYVMSIAGLG